MKRNRKHPLVLSLCFLTAFALWTAMLCRIDVQAIGPRNSAVGLAEVNRFFHSLTGVHLSLYVLTDWLGLIPVGLGMGFALLGLVQWVKRRSIARVDRSLLILGGFYLTVLAAYLFFEEFVVNYRPVLIDGCLEASYPSSTTLLALCITPTALRQLNGRIRRQPLRLCVSGLLTVFMVFMVAGRLLSGVHWLTDIIGGALLSAGLVKMYDFLTGGRPEGGGLNP